MTGDSVPIYTGAPGRDLSRDQFVAKFEDCHRHYREAGGASEVSTAEMIDAALGISGARDLTRLFEAFS